MTAPAPGGSEQAADGSQRPEAQHWLFVRDEDTGAGIPSPPRWQRREDTAAVVALVDPFVPRDRGFRPNVTVVVERPHEILADLDMFTARAVENMHGGLTDLHLIDIAPANIGGHEGRHVTSVYRSGIYPLALEQWWTVVAGLGSTLTATCAVEDYVRMAPVFEAIAAGFRPAAPDAGG